jgi:N-acetylglucosamine-6-phosphate deacetylase
VFGVRSIVLKGGVVVSPSGVSRSDVLIKGGHISRVDADLSGDEIIECKECYVLPGLRDQHIHDINGFMNYLDDSERLGKVSRALASQGVTAYMIATLAAPTENLVAYLRTIKEYMFSGRNGLDGARVEGANIEGTFIRKECAGAQPYEYIVSPNESEARKALKALLETGVVKLINIVPDYGTGLIEYAASRGVIVGCGHSLATAEQLAEGFRHGLKYIVHLTNGSMGRSFKPFYGGGTYEGAITFPLFVELIIDGYHVDVRYVSDIMWRRVQQERSHEIIAVTDGIFPIPEEVPESEFRMFSTLCDRSVDEGVFVLKGRVDKDGSVLPVQPNTLCSSKLTMNKAFENILNLLTTDFQGFMIDRKALPLHEAMRYASMFTSSNQALMQRVFDKTGSIEMGKSADLTVLSVEGEPGKYKVKVEKTLVAGKVFSSLCR